MTAPITPTPGNPGGTLNQILVDFEHILSTGNFRQAFNYKTAQFWTTLGAVAAVIVAWLNPSGSLDTPVQATISAVGGLVVAIFTAHAASKTPLTTLVRKLKEAGFVHAPRSVLAGTVVLNPSPAGQIGAEGYYAPGTASGSVEPSTGLNPSPGGGTTGRGGTTTGQTNQGNVVAPGGSIPTQQGGYSGGNTEPSTALGGNIGTNSAEGTGGPVISQRSGGLGTGGSVEAPGAYAQPGSPAANPDEAGSKTFVAKATPPRKLGRRKPKG